MLAIKNIHRIYTDFYVRIAIWSLCQMVMCIRVDGLIWMTDYTFIPLLSSPLSCGYLVMVTGLTRADTHYTGNSRHTYLRRRPMTLKDSYVLLITRPKSAWNAILIIRVCNCKNTHILLHIVYVLWRQDVDESQLLKRLMKLSVIFIFIFVCKNVIIWILKYFI